MKLVMPLFVTFFVVSSSSFLSSSSAFADGKIISGDGTFTNLNHDLKLHPNIIIRGDNGTYYDRFKTEFQKVTFIDVKFQNYSDASALFRDVTAGATVVCSEVKFETSRVPLCENVQVSFEN
jgi:hypothetical protein